MGYAHTLGDDTPICDRNPGDGILFSLNSSTEAKEVKRFLLSGALTAIVCCLVIAAGGCGEHTKKPTTKVVYVNINQLMPFHPSWTNIIQMDRILASPPSFRNPSGMKTLRLKKRFKPSQPLKDEINASINNNPNKSDVLQPAFNRIESMRNRINTQNNRILEQWRKTENQKALGEIAMEMNKLNSLQNQDTALVLQDYQSKIRVYQLRAIGYESYIRTYTGPLQDNARIQLADANQKIAELVKEMNAKIAEIEAKYAHTLRIYKDQVYKNMDASVKQREEKLRMETDNRLNRYKQDIQDNLNTLSGNGQSERNETSVPEMKAYFPLPKLPAFHMPSSQQSVNAVRNEMDAIKAQRRRLLQTIRSDIMGRISQIALKRNWTLSYHWKPGETDETKLFQQLLAQEFQPMMKR